MSKLESLRLLLKEEGIDGFIVGSEDRHQSEYVHEADQRRQFISEFTGSAGTALILQDRALLWTDGRYFLQASMELSSDWTLMRSGEPGVPDLKEYLSSNLTAGQSVGIDAYLMSTRNATDLQTLLKRKHIALKSVDKNLVDVIWGAARPEPPSGLIKLHPIEFAGQSSTEKIAQLQAEIVKEDAFGFVISALDEIAWLFNIRGSDISYNPVCISYALITTTSAHFFVDDDKLNTEVREYFGSLGVTIHPYEAIESFISDLAKTTAGFILADPAHLNWRLYSAMGDRAKSKVSSIALWKSKKNSAEINGMIEAHVRDGAALTAFLHWLRDAVRSAPGTISEYDVVKKVDEFRAKVPGFVFPSFGTLAGYGPNGAIIHYHCAEHSAAKLGIDSLFLLDSGGQYIDGTTDVTRTVHFGTPTQHMIDCFTLVLKGHIDLAKLRFPEGTVGSRFDCVARAPLWSVGLDFNHGTGHGVGAYLNVHEGPQGIGFRPRANDAGFCAGMTTSNEPGYYEEGSFGIRIENVCITVPAPTPFNFANRIFCELRTMTMTPIQSSLVNVSLLDDSELAWYNNYHAEVREKLLPLMEQWFPESVAYLIQETQPIHRAST